MDLVLTRSLARSLARIREVVKRAMGFTGSVCLHPRQVPVVNGGFPPRRT